MAGVLGPNCRYPPPPPPSHPSPVGPCQRGLSRFHTGMLWLRIFENSIFSKMLLSPLCWVSVIIWWQYGYLSTHGPPKPIPGATEGCQKSATEQPLKNSNFRAFREAMAGATGAERPLCGCPCSGR